MSPVSTVTVPPLTRTPRGGRHRCRCGAEVRTRVLYNGTLDQIGPDGETHRSECRLRSGPVPTTRCMVCEFEDLESGPGRWPGEVRIRCRRCESKVYRPLGEAA
jgi:hypothetical protein